MPLVRRRPLAGIATLGAAVAVIAGCGGGGSDTLSADEFRAKADAICAEYNTKSEALGEPSTPAEFLPALEEIIPLQQAQLTKLKDLEAPSELSGTFDEALALLDEQAGVISGAKDRLVAGDDPETVISELSTKASSLGDQADVKAKDLGLKVCGTDGSGTTTTPTTTTAPQTTTAPTTAGGVQGYVADVQAAAGALAAFGTLLQNTTSIDDLKSKAAEARGNLDTFDASIAKLDDYTLDIPRLDQQRAGLAETGPKVSDVLRRFLDAAAAGDLAQVTKLLPEVTSTIGEFQKAATG